MDRKMFLSIFCAVLFATLPVVASASTTFSANPTSGIAPTTVQFSGTTEGILGGWWIDFGDGQISSAGREWCSGQQCQVTDMSGAAFSHSYTHSGTFTAKLLRTICGSDQYQASMPSYSNSGYPASGNGSGSSSQCGMAFTTALFGTVTITVSAPTPIPGPKCPAYTIPATCAAGFHFGTVSVDSNGCTVPSHCEADAAPTYTPPIDCPQGSHSNGTQCISNTTSTMCPSITSSLSRGTRGMQVTQLQQFLISLGFLSSDSATGYFGPLTLNAVIKFQTRSNISAVGIVGPLTRAAIFRACSR